MERMKAWAVIRAWDDGKVAFLLPSKRPLIYRTRIEAVRHNLNTNEHGDIVHVEISEIAKSKPTPHKGDL